MALERITPEKERKISPDDSMMTKEGILRHRGMCLIHHYYKNKINAPESPIYILNHLSDLDIILLIAPKNKPYGIIVRSDDSEHKTPIVARKNEFIILDSLGDIGYMGPLATRIRDFYGSRKVIVRQIKFRRQFDTYSCGSEAFLVQKEALRLGDALFSFYDAQMEKDCDLAEQALPPSIAKYTQCMDQLDGAYLFVRKKGLFDKFPEFKSIPIRVNESKELKAPREETILDYLIRQPMSDSWSHTLENRREKHRKIIKEGVSSSTFMGANINAIIRDASGITLVQANIDRLMKHFHNEVMAICVPPKKWGGLTIVNYGVFADQAQSEKLLERISKQYAALEDIFFHHNEDIGFNPVTLRDLTILMCAKHYIKSKIEKLTPSSAIPAQISRRLL